MYKSFFKIIIDILLALVVLVVSLSITIPLVLVLAIANRGNPFFVQARPGRNSKVFKLIKFKTMNDKRDANGKPLPDKDRLTSIGRFIRSTSMDELPQLINVLKGDMSLVGPRPLLILSFLVLSLKARTGIITRITLL